MNYEFWGVAGLATFFLVFPYLLYSTEITRTPRRWLLAVLGIFIAVNFANGVRNYLVGNDLRYAFYVWSPTLTSFGGTITLNPIEDDNMVYYGVDFSQTPSIKQTLGKVEDYNRDLAKMKIAKQKKPIYSWWHFGWTPDVADLKFLALIDTSRE